MQALVQLKPFLIESLPLMSADKCHPLIVNGTQKDGYMDYTARILILDYRGDPIEVIMLIRSWLESKNLHLDPAGKDIQLSFNSEIIDSDTFDLEIDFPQRDKVIFSKNEYHVCPPIVWSDEKGGFFPAGE